MPLLSVCPYARDENKHQDHLTDITEEYFRSQLRMNHYTWYHRAYQIVCFIVFLGPIRVIGAALTFIIWGSIFAVTRALAEMFGYPPEVTDPFNWAIGQFGVRLLVFWLGIIWINVEGELKPDTRVILANHMSAIDPFAVISKFRVTTLLKKEFGRITLLRSMTGVTRPIYVDRSQACGQTDRIRQRAQDHSAYPLLIFPEGTICRGDIMLKFHKGGFIAGEKVQAICVRFYTPFLPGRDWNSFLWAGPGMPQMLWRVLSMPWSICHMKVLPQTSLEEFGEGDIEKYAVKMQLMMANELGVKAVNMSSDILYKKRAVENKEKRD